MFDDYFRILPWDMLPGGDIGIDVGCGSSRFFDPDRTAR
jgi:hypothetical protein